MFFRIASFVAACSLVACTISPLETADTRSATDRPSSDATDGATPSDGARCTAPISVRLDTPVPAEAELVVAWERLDGTFFVDRRVSDGVVSLADPPADARISQDMPSIAVGRVVLVAQNRIASGVVAGEELFGAIGGATFDDAIVWSSGAPLEATGWGARVRAGISIWKRSGAASKSEALVESRCDALRFVAGTSPNGDRFCDWH